MKRLSDIFPTISDFAGFFSAIQTAYGVDEDSNPLLWSDLDGDALSLIDIDFYAGHRNKLISTLLNVFDEESALSDLPDLVSLRCGSNWKAVYDAYFKTAYKPLENYSMEELRTPDLTEQIDTSANAKSYSEANSGVFGFNSEEASPASTSDNTTEGLEEDNFGSSTKTNTGTESLTRSGNIGVTTSQQMLQSEIELRKFDYWKMVYDDLDRILCRGIY